MTCMNEREHIFATISDLFAGEVRDIQEPVKLINQVE
jgi:hypothetical protein